MVGKDSNSLKDRPVFIPPRKRQATKKTNGNQNYVDHIVSVQSRQKPSPTSPALEDALIKTSLLLKNKQPLPQLPKDVLPLKSPSKNGTSHHSDTCESEDNELQNFDNLSTTHSHRAAVRRESATVTPSSCYSGSSLNAKLSKSQDCLTTRSAKKRVNIRTDLLSTRSPRRSPANDEDVQNPYEDLESGETSILNVEDNSLDRYSTRRSIDSYLTMTGTIKRGRKKGQSVDLQINISREELEKINAAALAAEVTKTHSLCCVCTPTTGFHVLLLSIMCLPFVMIATSIYSFYMGTLTWYNMFTYFNEEKSFFYRLLMSPLLILTYPMTIVVCTIGLGIYAGCIQLSMQLTSWLNEIADIEKGFYGWLCGFLKLSDCSPYEVVILTELQLPEDHVTVHSSMEELSL